MSAPNRFMIPSRLFLVDGGRRLNFDDLPAIEKALVRRRVTDKAVCVANPETGEEQWIPLKAMVASNHPSVFSLRGWFAKKVDAGVMTLPGCVNRVA